MTTDTMPWTSYPIRCIQIPNAGYRLPECHNTFSFTMSNITNRPINRFIVTSGQRVLATLLDQNLAQWITSCPGWANTLRLFLEICKKKFLLDGKSNIYLVDLILASLKSIRFLKYKSGWICIMPVVICSKIFGIVFGKH